MAKQKSPKSSVALQDCVIPSVAKGSKPLTPSRLRRRIGEDEYKRRMNEVRRWVGRGRSLQAIAANFVWPLNEVRVLMDGFLITERGPHGALEMDADSQYLRLNVRMDAIIRSLDKTIKKARDDGEYSAAVSGLRQKSEIVRRLFESGREMGIINRKHVQNQENGLVDPRKDRDVLKAAIRDAALEFSQIVSKYGIMGVNGVPVVDSEEDDMMETIEKSSVSVPSESIDIELHHIDSLNDVELEPEHKLPAKSGNFRSRGGLSKRAGGNKTKANRVIRQKLVY